ncbi:dihydrolipoamide dehydrogenase [archaeon]|nr:dihydrolipoamide dehydrogenase [archaeon]|tara:strand:+ start:11134 stop:12504 length:1371 start_codon:yes stop_codon:yes gene_type:complete
MKQFDLIVIGTGSGLDVAYTASEKGLKVALLEKDKIGGTCLNRGCIPSKMLIHSADVADQIRNSKTFGIESKITKINFEAIIKRVNSFVDTESKGMGDYYKTSKNPVLFKGEAKFIDFKTLQIGKETIKADKILIAAGARPNIPPIPGLDSVNYITSTEALRLKKQPKEMTVLGGGYISTELAHFYRALGTKVNIIQRSSWLLTKEDQEISKAYTEAVKGNYNLFLNHDIVKVYKNGNKFITEVKDQKTKKVKKVSSDELLVVLGAKPNSDLLDLEKTKVKIDDKGFIKTNDYLETNVPGIYALGDIAGHYMFKHSANLEGEYATNNILNPKNKRKVDYSAMPHAVFTTPQIAGVGYTEEELKQKKIPYLKGKHMILHTGMGKALEDKVGFVKFLVDKKTRKILGCHILGTEASTLIHEVLVAMKSGSGTIDNIQNVTFIHPALSEVVQRAAFNLE